MGTTRSPLSKPTRRTVLRAGLAWAACPWLGGARGATNGRDERTLVLLHLSGGNDGLNTFIPYTDPLYYELRPSLSRVAGRAIRVTDRVAFHPSLSGVASLFRRGRVAIIQGVGYVEADYSHFGSCRIWATGSTDPAVRTCWWEGAVEDLARVREARAVSVGDCIPARMIGSASRAGSPIHAGSVGSSASRNPLGFRSGRMREVMTQVYETVLSGSPPAVVCAAVGGFDTHDDQPAVHDVVLRELSDALVAFQKEIERRKAADRVLLVAWSEFGRRPAENATGGTDHGTAGPVMVIGKRVRCGIHGATPSLRTTDYGSLIPTIDFRSVYALLAGEWLGCPLSPIRRSAGLSVFV